MVKKSALLASLFLSIILGGGYLISATSPCFGISDEEFVSLVDRAEVIVRGKVGDYGSLFSRWTEIEVEEVLRGELDDDEITIKDWVAYDPPAYADKEGREMIFLLKKEGDGVYKFVLSEKERTNCISAINRRSSNPNYSDKFSVHQNMMTLEEFKQKYLK